MYAYISGQVLSLELPDPVTCVLPGIQWGAFDELFTPAYWAGQSWQHSLLSTYTHQRLGRTLCEEMAACLLGGYGMPAELGLRAYERVKDLGFLEASPTEIQLEAALSLPFTVAGRTWRYRFPRQKARYLIGAMAKLRTIDEDDDDVGLRHQLLALPGIGLKTASWIVRNLRNSNQIAIIDVHILRMGRTIGIFDGSLTPERDYISLENSFLAFSDALGTHASALDGLIWDHMRKNFRVRRQRNLFEIP